MSERVFALPDLGEGLEEGTIVTWLVGEGDQVALNQPLVEVETAKATIEIPSPFAGRIMTLHGKEGDAIPVGAPLATFEVDARPAPPRVRSTPPVRKLASMLGVDIATVTGTGPDGRVTDDDVRRVAGREANVGDAVAVTVQEKLPIERIALNPVRRSIAQNLVRQAAIPQVTTFRTVECSALEAFRRELDVSPLPIVVAALCRTIEGHPLLNACWADDAVELRGAVNVAIAVDTERGVVVPIVADAAKRGIGELAAEIRRVAEAARAGGVSLEDIARTPTIAVSNTGSYGSEAGTPILSPGTSVTLALGVIAPRALVVESAVVARPAATISLTFDHRVMDGAGAGRALSDLVDGLQTPERLRDLPR